MSWAPFAIPCAGGLVFGLLRGAFSVLYPAIEADTHWSLAALVGAYGAQLLSYSVFSVPTGVLLDRFGVRLLVVSGLVIAGLGTAVTSLLLDLGLFYLIFGALVGAGLSGVGFASQLKVLASRPTRLGMGLGVFGLAQGAGLALGTFGSGVGLESWGWRATLLAVGMGILLLIPVIMIATPQANSRSKGMNHRGVGRRSLNPAPFILLMFSNFALGCWVAVPTHQVARLVEGGFAFRDAVTYATLAGLLALVASPLLGWASDRWDGWLLGATSVVAGIGAVALAFAAPSQLILLVTYLVGAGIARAGLGLAIGAIEGRIIPYERVGAGVGVLELGIGFGSLFGPWVSVVLRDVYGSYAPGLVLIGVTALFAGASAEAARRAWSVRPSGRLVE